MRLSMEEARALLAVLSAPKLLVYAYCVAKGKVLGELKTWMLYRCAG